MPTAVATVSGRTVRVVGEGTAVLVATQAASGSYLAASVQVQLTVSARPDPTTDRQVTGGLQAQVEGYTTAFAWAAGLLVLGALVSAVLIRATKEDLPAEGTPVHVG